MLVVILGLFCGFDCTVADSVLLFAVGCVRLGGVGFLVCD